MEVGSRGVGWRSLIGGGRAEILVDHDGRLRRRIASGDIGRRLVRLRGSVAVTVSISADVDRVSINASGMAAGIAVTRPAIGAEAGDQAAITVGGHRAGAGRKCGGASGDSWRGHGAPRTAAGRSMPQARKNDVAKATDRPVLGGERSNG